MITSNYILYYHLEVSHYNCWCCLKYALKKISPASLEQHESVNFMWSCIMSRCSDDACYLQFRILPLSLLSQIIHAIICPLAATPQQDFCFSGNISQGQVGRGEGRVITTILPRYDNEKTVWSEICEWFSSLY